MENLDQLLETIRTDLISFIEQRTETQGTKLEKTSVLSCAKLISESKGRDAWAFFCSIINFSVKVQKFMIPMLNGIAKSIITFFKGDFIAFLNSDIHSKKVLLQNFCSITFDYGEGSPPHNSYPITFATWEEANDYLWKESFDHGYYLKQEFIYILLPLTETLLNRLLKTC